MALVNYLEIPIRIIYLDANPKKAEADIMQFPEDVEQTNIFATFLYRPGHYDILY